MKASYLCHLAQTHLLEMSTEANQVHGRFLPNYQTVKRVTGHMNNELDNEWGGGGGVLAPCSLKEKPACLNNNDQ